MGETEPTESRQVRRARERAEGKGSKTDDRKIAGIEAALQLMQDKSRKEYYSAPRRHEGSPPPHPEAHPQRYPHHDDPEKGQVYGGECNTTACERRNAVFWNMGTYGLYCRTCADGQNWQRNKPPLTIYVEDRPHTLEEMAQIRVDNDYAKIF